MMYPTLLINPCPDVHRIGVFGCKKTLTMSDNNTIESVQLELRSLTEMVNSLSSKLTDLNSLVETLKAEEKPDADHLEQMAYDFAVEFTSSYSYEFADVVDVTLDLYGSRGDYSIEIEKETDANRVESLITRAIEQWEGRKWNWMLNSLQSK